MDQSATEGGGVVTTGIGDGTDSASGVDSGADDGADETGEPPPYYCIYSNKDNPQNLTGTKQQCNLEYDLDISFTITPAVGSPFQIPLQVTSVQTVSETSTYEHPYVAICCTDVTDHPDWEFDDSCGYEHHKACMSDFIEHICNAPGNWLEAIAPQYLGQGSQVIVAASDWLKDNRQACYNHFWTGPDSLHNADRCDSEFDGYFDHTPWEPSTSFAFAPFGAVLFTLSDLHIAPRSSFGEHVPVAPPSPAESCNGPETNNGEVPPLYAMGATGSSFSLVAPTAVDVTGPQINGDTITGSGEFGTMSTLQWYTNVAGDLEIEHWTMVEDSPTTAGTASTTATIDAFKATPVFPQTVAPITGGWRIPTGSTLFNLAATVDGIGNNVQAANASPIDFHTVSGGTDDCPATVVTCLVSSSFTIDYEDAFTQSWTVDIASATWQP